MSNTTPVLPNFLKALTIATFSLVSVTSFAGHHETKPQAEKERIVELNEMTDSRSDKAPAMGEQAPLKARNLTDADAAKAESDLADEINATTKKLNEEPDSLNRNR